MESSSPPENVMAAIAADSDKPPPSDKMDALVALAERARDLEALIEDLDQSLRDAKSELVDIFRSKMVDAMDLIGLPAIEIDARGNLPAMSFRSQSFYSANIAASWPDEKKSEAFKYLEESGAGDLIKTSVSVAFPREKREDALRAVKYFKELGESPEVDERVYTQTLSTWLRESIEEGEHVDLEKIGGFIGRIVKMKQIKS